MKKWFIIGLIGTIILAVVLTITVQIILEENSQQEIYQQRAEVQEEEENRELAENELAMTSTTGEDKISPNAVIYFKTYYTECKHTTALLPLLCHWFKNRGKKKNIGNNFIRAFSTF